MGLVAARFVLVRTCGRRERPPALCAVWAWSPLACGRVPYPPYARCGMGRLCGERMGPGCAAVSVASDRREQETRLGAGVGGWPRPPLAAWGAGLHRPAVRHGGRGCTGPATCERFACPKDARNAAWGRRRRFMPMGCAIYPRIYVARCDAVWRGVSRLGRYILGYARHAPAPAAAGASPRPPLAPWGAGLARHAARKRFERPKDARNAAWDGRWRFMPMGCAIYPRIYVRVVMRYGVACRVWDGIS